MSLQLNSIEFNFDKSSGTVDALNLRINKDYILPTPEFLSTKPRRLEQSCAAYAISETKGKSIYIKVNFKLPAAGPQEQTYQVRAMGGGILGMLPETIVTFQANTPSRTQFIELKNRRFKAIGKHDVRWEWSCRAALQENNGRYTWDIWKPLAQSNHRVFILLHPPAVPWTNGLNQTSNAWSELLEICCQIAGGCKDEASALKALTKSVNADYKLKYDIELGKGRYTLAFTQREFQLSKWITQVLQGKALTVLNNTYLPGTKEEYNEALIVNCEDCGLSLAIMAAVLGIPAETHFHFPFGYLHYVEPIGRGKCNDPFYYQAAGHTKVRKLRPAKGKDSARTFFQYHIYACHDSRYYDACMKEWLPAGARLALLLVWGLLSLITLGQASAFRERALGWLVSLTRNEYTKSVIDTSQEFEWTEAGYPSNVGHPVKINVIIHGI
ncbi:MAG: hypothetical protein JXA13_07345 [Anaerolineales bacterium]|nr:hypothetical protein [Anaerolineales bacterium]